jgi:protoporphyrinogen oxidase
MNTIVIGAGIAGLTVAEALASRGEHVTLIEKYGVVGGRIATMHREAKDGIPALQYEIGAGRIFYKHNRVLKLIREMKLGVYPISMEGTEWRGKSTGYASEPNDFTILFSELGKLLQTLPDLGTFTIAELLKKVAPPEFQMALTLKYPYWSEINMMRADLALESFEKGGTMEAHDATSYLGVVEGLYAITNGLAEKAKKAGVTLLTHHHVSDIHLVGKHSYEVVGEKGKKEAFALQAKRVVVATCRCTAGSFPSLKSIPLFKLLDTEPLIRIYAVYPKVKGKVWFAGMGKVITDSPLRHVIPINEEKGLIMISYTDGKDCEVWSKLEQKDLEKKMAMEVEKVFGKVPAPLYLKMHEWGAGCTYWKPGKYDPVEMGELAYQPFKAYPTLHLCGESYSMQQAWIEGALESAEGLLKKILPK